jgi:cation:H+ antiporter
VIGLVLLVIGAEALVRGASKIALSFGVSPLVIGLTIVAYGTRAPDMAVSIQGAVTGQVDIAIGNVVGSNTFNILAVLGASSLVAREPLAVAPTVLAFDLPVMTAVAVACLPVFFTGRQIARWEGVVFLGYFVAYTAYLILSAQHHDGLPLLSMTMLSFVVPLTLITLLVGLKREVRSGRPARKNST